MQESYHLQLTPKNDWDLDAPLFYWSPSDPFTMRMALESILGMGQTGSGKTTALGATFLRAWLRAKGRPGMLACCVKPGEANRIMALCRECGREQDVIRVAADEPWRCNILDLEVSRQGRGGGQTENVVALLQTISELAEGRVGQDKGETFWPRSSQMAQRNTLELLMLAKSPLTLNNICRFMREAPHSRDEVGDPKWQAESFCARIISQAEANIRTEEDVQGFKTATAFWLKTWPELGERTRSSVEITWLSVADMLLHGVMHTLFFTTSNFSPADSWRDGKIIILDLPTLTYHRAGAICQGIFKYCWQRAILQRDVTREPRPCVLYMDEFQEVVTSMDWEFASVSRESRACTVALTQSLHTIMAKLGGESARSEVFALLGNLVTKVTHATSDPVTATWIADIIAQEWQVSTTYSTGQGGTHTTAGGSQVLAYKLLPGEMAKLARGGPANGYCVEAIVTQGGRIFRATGDTWLKCTFKQRN